MLFLRQPLKTEILVCTNYACDFEPSLIATLKARLDMPQICQFHTYIALYFNMKGQWQWQSAFRDSYICLCNYTDIWTQWHRRKWLDELLKVPLLDQSTCSVDWSIKQCNDLFVLTSFKICFRINNESIEIWIPSALNISIFES